MKLHFCILVFAAICTVAGLPAEAEETCAEKIFGFDPTVAEAESARIGYLEGEKMCQRLLSRAKRVVDPAGDRITVIVPMSNLRGPHGERISGPLDLPCYQAIERARLLQGEACQRELGKW